MRAARTAAGWLGVALVLVGAPAWAASGDVLFSESFERYAEGQRIGAPWSGGFSARGGALHLESGLSNPVCALDRSFAGDVSFSLRVLGAQKSHWTGFAAKGVYWLTVSRENGTLALVKRDQGQVAALGDVFDYYWYLWATRDFELRLDIVGDRLRVFADGKLLIEATDPGASARRGPLWLVGGYGSDTRFDDVRVTEADPSPIAPTPTAAPSALELVDARCDRPDSIYDDGQPVTLSATLRAKNPAGGTFDVRFEVLDIDEQPVWTLDRTLTLPAGGAVTEVLTLTPPRRGGFKLRAVQPGTAPPPAVAPPPPPPPAAAPPPRRGFFKRILARIGRVFTFWKKRPAPVAPPAPAPPPPPTLVGDAYDDLISFAVIPAAVRDLPADAGSIMGGHPWAEQADEHAALSRRMGQRWARTHDFIQWT